jgi:CheY-like chemotaxis protein
MLQDCNLRPVHGSGPILLVEDEPLLRMLLAEFLIERGFDVIEAGNAREAMVALQDVAIGIRAVFTDIRMPGEMDGFGLAAWIRSNLNVPVILTSGDVGQANGARNGSIAHGFVAKPYELHAVAKLLKDTVSRFAHLNFASHAPG